jgi:hypothetical protein
VDLHALGQRLRQQAAVELAELDRLFPGALQWGANDATVALQYPVLRYASHPRAVGLAADKPVAGTLLGIKGQYLLLSSGVFNVRRHSSYHVTLARGVPDAPAASVNDEQLNLF